MTSNQKFNVVSFARRVLYLTAVTFTLTLSVLALSQGVSREATLIVGTSFNLKTLDPGRSFELTAILSNKALYETLVTLPDNGEGDVVPQLAQSWQISSDGLSYTFKLREGVRFSSGNPLTSADVAWSIERFKGLKGPASFLAESIQSVKALDLSTVVVTLSRPDPALLSKLTVDNFAILDSKTLIARGGTSGPDADRTDRAESFLNSQSAGTGPYALASTDLSTQVVLQRNPNYWRKPAPLTQYILRNIPETAVESLTLQKGDIDIALDITADQIKQLRSDPKVRIVNARSLITLFLGFNKDPSITGDTVNRLGVEQAIRAALDYKGIDSLAGPGSITPATVIPLGLSGSLDASFAPQRDLERARNLLKQAGLADGFSIPLEYPGGFTFGGVDFDVLAQKVQADLAEIGIKVKLAPAQVDAFFTRLRAGKAPFFISFWTPDFLDALNYTAFLPGGIFDKRTNWNLESKTSVYQELQQLSQQVEVITDSKKRIDLFRQIQLSLRDNGPFVALVQPATPIATRDNIAGYVFNPQWRVDPYLVKGLSELRVLRDHILKNALTAPITIIGLAYGQLLSGAVLTEVIFAWPGIGRYAFQAATKLDFPAIMGTALVIALSYSLINLAVDILHAFLDPRIKEF